VDLQEKQFNGKHQQNVFGKKFKDYKQRKCCYKRIRCRNHKRCRIFKESCKYVGPKVTSQKQTKCKDLKSGNGIKKKMLFFC